MKNKPRILILENSTHVTGALKSVTRTAFDLRRFYDFYFVVPKTSKGRYWIENLGFRKIVGLGYVEISRRLIPLIFYFPMLLINAIRLRKIVSKNAIDLIHSNDLYNMLPVMLKILGSPVPYISHIRFMPDNFPPVLFNFWLSLHFRFAERIIVVSETLKSRLPSHPKVITILNELPVEEKYPAEVSMDSKPPFSFLYLGNFIRGKGQDHALEAFQLIHHQLPDWRLRFVGSDMGLKKNGLFMEDLRKEAVQFGISEKITWSGFMDQVELEYKKADIVLNFSESESFSITCLEALFFGRPLIATDCGGPSEIIENNLTGILVKNRSVVEMARAMVKLATDPALRENFSRNARISVREKFNIENTSFRLKKVYESTINKE